MSNSFVVRILLEHSWDTRIRLSLLALGLFYFFYYIWRRIFSFQGLPSQLPWAGAGYDTLRRGRASWQSFFGLRELLVDGYENYSKREQPFILPNIVTGHEVILPMSQMRWLLERSDDVLSQHEVNKQFLCAEYTMLHHNIIGKTRMGDFIRREMTRDLDFHAQGIVDEIEQALEATWGSDPAAWREIPLYHVMLNIIGRLVNRVFVGAPLCRDPVYLRCSTSFAHAAPVTGGMISLLPSWLKPVFGPAITAFDTYQYRRLARIIKPMVQDRLIRLGPGVTLDKGDTSQPNDFIQWALSDAFNQNDPEERTAEMITKRLAVTSFAAIQSSAITVTNALFDIAASTDSVSIQQSLRQEAQETAAKNTTNGWTRATLASMTLTDSVLRESLRLWSFVSHGVTKAVVHKEGITLPSGQHLPQGAKCGIANYGPQHDPAVYDKPYNYDPFRFCREDRRSEKAHAIGGVIRVGREEGGGGGGGGGGTQAPSSFVTTSDYMMGFSHGRNACPGRFFAAQQLKLLVANIMLKYDIEPLSTRPKNQWLNNTIGPPVFATIRVRRRTSTTDGRLDSTAPSECLPVQEKEARRGGVSRTLSSEVRAMC